MSSNYIDLPISGGVSSLNNLAGALTLIAGTNITIVPSGSTLTINSTGGGGGSGTVTSVGLVDSTGLFTITGSPVTVSGSLTISSLNSQTANKFLASPNGSSGSPSFRSIVSADLPSISLTTGVSGILPAANGGSPPVTRNLYVDNSRTDSFTADGSLSRPFATISAAISQIITNADNSTHPYSIAVAIGSYNETLTFNSSLLYNISFETIGGSAGGSSGVVVNNPGTNVLVSTSNNTQLSTLVFSGFTFNGNVNLVGDVNNTNFGSTQILFNGCPFNLSSGGITLTNVNNVSFYGGQMQGSSTSTFTNVAFAYVEGAEGFKAGTTLALVQNNSGNQPSQSSGNYLLFSESKCYSSVTIDAGSEMDSLLSYFGSGSSVVNNGTIHSWQTGWNGTLTGNNGSLTRVQGDIFLNAPTINAGATFTNRGIVNAANATLGASAVAATNTILVMKDGHVKSTQTTAPTVTLTNSGTSPTGTLSNATDTAGKINYTPDTGVSSSATFTVNFNKAYNVAPIVTLTPVNSTAGINLVQKYVTSTVNGFTVNFATAPVAANTYNWFYHVVETQ